MADLTIHVERLGHLSLGFLAVPCLSEQLADAHQGMTLMESQAMGGAGLG